MDPLSIATGAAGLAISCATIVKTLYTWIDDTIDVDENVSNLFEEISSLSRALESIRSASVRVPQAILAEIDPGNGLWSTIGATFIDMKTTFNRLNQLMAELEKTSFFSRGFLRKPTKQIRFSLRSKDISTHRDRIKSYNTAMISALQMINVCLLIHSNSSQDSVFRVLSGLKSQVRRVEVALQTSSSTDSGDSVAREEDDRMLHNLRQFVQVAESFHSSASTIVRDGPRSTIWGGSILGVPLTEAQKSRIEGWIRPPVHEEPYTPTDSGSQSDTDNEAELARRIEELAVQNDKNGDYARAEQFYRSAIEHCEASSRPPRDLKTMRVRLAYSCMQQEKWTEAEEIIAPIAFEKKTNDLLVYHSMHALAIENLDALKLQEAEKYCKRALWGKRKVLGRDHSSCWESLALLASICMARNMIVEAEAHRSFIPRISEISVDVKALIYLERSVGGPGSLSGLGDDDKPTQQPLDSEHPLDSEQPLPIQRPFYFEDLEAPVDLDGSQSLRTLPSERTGLIGWPFPLEDPMPLKHLENRESRQDFRPPNSLLSLTTNDHSGARCCYMQGPFGFAMLNKFDPSWDEHFGAELKLQNLSDETFERIKEFILLFLREGKKTESLHVALSPSPSCSTAAETDGLPKSSFGTSSLDIRQYYESDTRSFALPKPKFKIFASVDYIQLGCENTQVAYVVHGLERQIADLVIEWPGSSNHNASLVPTILYYDKYDKLVGWGHDVAHALDYRGYQKPGIQKVECFPLHLITQPNVVDHSTLPPLPSGLDYSDVSADFLCAIRSAVHLAIQKRLGLTFDQDDVSYHWNFTVPGIMAEDNKEILRRVIARAGFPQEEMDEHLSFISHCEATMHREIVEGRVNLDPKSSFIFVACGKTAVELSGYELVQISPLAISKLRAGSIHACGSISIQRNFYKLLCDKVRFMKLRGNYRLTAKAYARCILDFTKRIMMTFCNDGFRWAVDVGIAKDFCVAGFEEGFMVFTNDEILSCFRPVTDIIVEMICEEIREVSKTGRAIEAIVIAGELSFSKFLLDEIKYGVPSSLRDKIFQSSNPASEVVTGAAHLAMSRFVLSNQHAPSDGGKVSV
ncbi:Ff.00g113280.m01.CDS01 [Fusarium sp. VM40]|nr:Ff.00g113280.m01.CDS01 [Fusarium sp. VM40]